MARIAAHLVEHVLPEQPIRQWVLWFPYPLRFLFATRPAVLTQVLGIVYRTVSTFLVCRAGVHAGVGARTGAVTLIQRFGSALNFGGSIIMMTHRERCGNRIGPTPRGRRCDNPRVTKSEPIHWISENRARMERLWSRQSGSGTSVTYHRCSSRHRRRSWTEQAEST